MTKRTNRGSAVSRAIAAGPSKPYLAGYVVGIVYHDGFEWLLTKNGAWAGSHEDPHVWPTHADAMKLMRKVESTSRFPVFVREYVYSTSNPANAKGMQPYRKQSVVTN